MRPAAGEYAARAGTSVAALQSFYDRERGLWRTTGWWNAANALAATIDYMARTGDRTYADVVANTFEKNCWGRFLNEFYDDEGWWALTWIKAYDLTHERRYLDAARTIFDDMRRGWDGVCGGGMWWNKERRYKNAITNELFLTVAARLHLRVTNEGERRSRFWRLVRGPVDYLEWAARTWTWFARSGLINVENLVNDGLTPDCRNNGGVTWTYNQGVILGGLVSLYESTRDESLVVQARAIADAAIAALSDENGVLVEPREPDLGDDGPQFKGIFVRNLYDLFEWTHDPRYREFLIANAEAIWSRNRSPGNYFGVRWTGPFDRADAARQSSAIDAINAVLAFDTV